MNKSTSASTKKQNSIKIYLNSSTKTILGTAMALSVGWAFKNLIDTGVSAVIEPLIVYIITILGLNKITDFSKYITKQNNTLNVSIFIQTLVSFFIIISISYVIFNYYIIGNNASITS